jgi:hypothetical protein
MDMTSHITIPPTHHLLVVRPEPPGQYTAVVVGIPEIRVRAASEQEAIEQAQKQLREWMANAHWIRVDTSAAPGTKQPGQVKAVDECEMVYLEELKRQRQEDSCV